MDFSLNATTLVGNNPKGKKNSDSLAVPSTFIRAKVGALKQVKNENERKSPLRQEEVKPKKTPGLELTIPEGQFPPEHVRFTEDVVANTITVSEISAGARDLWGLEFLEEGDEMLEINGRHVSSFRRGARLYEITRQSKDSPLLLGFFKPPKLLGPVALAAIEGKFEVQFGYGEIGLELQFDDAFQQVRIYGILEKSLAAKKKEIQHGLFLRAINGYVVDNMLFEHIIGMLRFESMTRPLTLTFSKTSGKDPLQLLPDSKITKKGFDIRKQRKFEIPHSHTIDEVNDDVGLKTKHESPPFSEASFKPRLEKGWTRFLPHNSRLQIREIWQKKKVNRYASSGRADDNTKMSVSISPKQNAVSTLQISNSKSQLNEEVSAYDNFPYIVDCSHKGLTAEKLYSFFEKHIRMNFVSMDLRGNPFFDNGAEALYNGLHKAEFLEQLMVDSCKIGPQGFNHLSRLLEESTSLIIFSAENNFAGGVGAEYLGAALKVMSRSEKSRLQTFNIRSNRITTAGCKSVLLGLGNNKSVLNVYLCSNDIDDRAVDVISEVLKRNSTIQRLHLSYNKINDVGLSMML
jgi:hypothetical protein